MMIRLCACTSTFRSSNPQSEHRTLIFEDKVFIAHPAPAIFTRNTGCCPSTCHEAGRGAEEGLRNEQLLPQLRTEINQYQMPALYQKPQMLKQTPEFQICHFRVSASMTIVQIKRWISGVLYSAIFHDIKLVSFYLKVPPIWVSLMYSYDQIEVMHYGKGYHRGDMSSSAHHIWSYLMSTCIICDVGHFPKMGSTKTLH